MSRTYRSNVRQNGVPMSTENELMDEYPDAILDPLNMPVRGRGFKEKKVPEHEVRLCSTPNCWVCGNGIEYKRVMVHKPERRAVKAQLREELDEWAQDDEVMSGRWQ